jgi:hypothetical protein
MVIRKFLDDLQRRINEKASSIGKEKLCQLHDNASTYHYIVGMIHGLTEGAKISEDLWADLISPDKSYGDRIEARNEYK